MSGLDIKNYTNMITKIILHLLLIFLVIHNVTITANAEELLDTNTELLENNAENKSYMIPLIIFGVVVGYVLYAIWTKEVPPYIEHAISLPITPYLDHAISLPDQSSELIAKLQGPVTGYVNWIYGTAIESFSKFDNETITPHLMFKIAMAVIGCDEIKSFAWIPVPVGENYSFTMTNLILQNLHQLKLSESKFDFVFESNFIIDSLIQAHVATVAILLTDYFPKEWWKGNSLDLIAHTFSNYNTENIIQFDYNKILDNLIITVK